MRKKHLPIIALLIFLLIVGVLIVSDYGESYDEYLHVLYGEYTFNNFERLFLINESIRYGPDNLSFYGPFFDFIIHIGTQLILKISPGLSIITIRHFFHYLSFLIAAASLYSIATHIFKTHIALLTTILFITQPLLWGHAFINPKDIPFMSAFLLSIAVGLYASKRIKPLAESLPVTDKIEPLQLIKSEWTEISKKRSFLTGLSIFFSLLVIILISHDWIYGVIEKTINNFYINEESFLGSLFFQYAANALSIPASSYIEKSMILINRFIRIFSFGGVFLFCVWFFQLLPKSRAIFWKQKLKPFLMDIVVYIKNPWILFTGACIGVATAIRIIGPFAGMLIVVLLFLKYKQKSIPQIIAIGLMAMSITYIFWPYLWVSPIKHFIESLTVMSDFPWLGSILLNGEFFASVSLPREYLPLLISIQFTEPIIILFFIGLGYGIKEIVVKAKFWELNVIFLVWFLILIIGVVLLNPIMYDNFRQFLFIIPPIFLFVGLSLENIFKKIKNKQIQWIFALLILFPGIYSIVTLHPYQYTYYNSFVGGSEGTFRRFEADYWNTSYKEAIEYLNEIAPENSRILVWGSPASVQRIARKDLIVEGLQGGTFDQETGYDYGIQTTRWNRDLNNFPNAPILFSVEREGAIFVVVKQLKCTENNPCP